VRLLLIAPGFHAHEREPFVPYWGELVAGLSKAHDVTVLALRRPAGRRPYRVFGARVVPLPLGDVRLRRSPRLWAAALSAAWREARRGRFDAIHSLHANEAGFLGSLAGAALSTPVVAHIGGGELTGLPDLGYGSDGVWIERLQVRWSLRHAKIVTVGCHAMARRAEERLVALRKASASSARVRYAPFGVDFDRFRPSQPAEAGAVLHVGDLVGVKDQSTLLEAFAHARASGAASRLHVVGSGPRIGDLRRLAGRLAIDDAVRWWGAVPHAAVHVAYRRASAYASASRHEAQGVALAEAAASGLPIASTSVGVAPELPTEATWLAEPGDPAGLGHAMSQALKAGAAGPQAGLGQRRAAEARFAWPVALERFVNVYTEAAGRPVGMSDQPSAPS
jgi:glycosyltransferase involved in cell wall biosynthesis